MGRWRGADIRQALDIRDMFIILIDVMVLQMYMYVRFIKLYTLSMCNVTSIVPQRNSLKLTIFYESIFEASILFHF